MDAIDQAAREALRKKARDLREQQGYEWTEQDWEDEAQWDYDMNRPLTTLEWMEYKLVWPVRMFFAGIYCKIRGKELPLF